MVVLRSVNLTTSGRYRCEVSTEGQFITESDSGALLVVGKSTELIQKNPAIFSRHNCRHHPSWCWKERRNWRVLLGRWKERKSLQEDDVLVNVLQVPGRIREEKSTKERKHLSFFVGLSLFFRFSPPNLCIAVSISISFNVQVDQGPHLCDILTGLFGRSMLHYNCIHTRGASLQIRLQPSASFCSYAYSSYIK